MSKTRAEIEAEYEAACDDLQAIERAHRAAGGIIACVSCGSYGCDDDCRGVDDVADEGTEATREAWEAGMTRVEMAGKALVALDASERAAAEKGKP